MKQLAKIVTLALAALPAADRPSWISHVVL